MLEKNKVPRNCLCGN